MMLARLARTVFMKNSNLSLDQPVEVSDLYLCTALWSVALNSRHTRQTLSLL